MPLITFPGPLVGPLGVARGANPSLLLTGLVGYWTMDETGTGTRADSTANADTLSNNAAVTDGAGKINNASAFSKASVQYLSHVNNASLTYSTAFSFSLWLRPGDTGLAENVLQSGSFDLDVESGTDLRCYAHNAFTYNVWQAKVSVGTFYHVVGVYDGSQGTNIDRIKLYVNGTVQTLPGTTGNLPASVSDTFATEVGRAGAFSASTGASTLEGRVDELGLWNVALTAAQVTSLYNSGTGLTYPFAGAP